MEDEELTCRDWYHNDRGVLHSGWWRRRQEWGLGIGVMHQRSAPSWGEIWTLGVEMGPFTWGLTWEELR